MSRLRRWPLVLLIVLAIGMTPWPWTAMAITPQTQTVHIIDTHDDGFVTEVGIGIDSALVHILDPGMDLRAFLVFRDIEINYWEPLKNATLRLRTSNLMDFDADSSVTIHGISLDNLQLEGWLGPAFIMSAPLTGAHVNVNTSQFYGQAWHEIDVTGIVEELIRHYNWDGDGHDGTETGDAIGFIILGAPDDTRYFYDYRGNPSLSADLVIHWNHAPPPPTGYEDATYNQTLGNWTIWVISYSTLIDMAYWDGSKEQYMEINTNSSDVEIPDVSSQGNRPASYQIVRGPENDIFYLGRVGTNQTLFHSYDEGETWDNYTLNDQYAELIGNSNKDGSLAFDSSGALWVVWASKSLSIPTGFYRIHATNITIEEHILTFSTTVGDIGPTRAGYSCDQNRPSLWLDANDCKHITYDGKYPPSELEDHIFYKYEGGAGWTDIVILDNLAKIHHRYSQMVTSSNGTFKLVVWEVEGDLQYAYFKTVWVKTQDLESEGVANNYGPHTSYNDNEDKVLAVYEHDDKLSSKIFNFTDLSLTSRHNVGLDAIFPDLTFDISKNDALAVYDAGVDGIQGIIYHFNNESWGTNFTIRDTNPGYIHTLSLGIIDIGGTGEPDESWYAYDPDTNQTHGPFDDLDDVIDFIEGEDPDPQDPNPADEWPDEGPFTRFNTRMYIFIVGFFMVWGTVWFFAWKRPDGYYLLVGALFIIMGIGLIIHSVSI